MRTLNNLKRLCINYLVLLGILSAMVLIVDLSDRQVQHAVEALETKNHKLGEDIL